MAIERVYPNDNTQVGRLLNSTKPSLDQLHDLLEALSVTSHPITPASGWTFAPGAPTAIRKVGPLCTLSTTLLWGTGGSGGNLFSLEAELRPSLTNTVGIGTFVNQAAGTNPARVGELFCNPVTGQIAYSANHSTGLANNAQFYLQMTWVVDGA